MRTRQSVRRWLLAGALAVGLITTVVSIVPAQAAGGPNLAAGKAATASSTNSGFPASNVNDGNQGSYWESANNAFPQWVQVDLGSAQSASRVVLQLPAAWGARVQRIEVVGSTNNSTWTTLKAATDYTFAPGSNNTVTITFTASTQRYFRLNIQSNNAWPAGQISAFQVWNN